MEGLSNKMSNTRRAVLLRLWIHMAAKNNTAPTASEQLNNK